MPPLPRGGKKAIKKAPFGTCFRRTSIRAGFYPTLPMRLPTTRMSARTGPLQKVVGALIGALAQMCQGQAAWRCSHMPVAALKTVEDASNPAQNRWPSRHTMLLAREMDL